MPRLRHVHLPAPTTRAVAPGAAYCGALPPYPQIGSAELTRAWAVRELAAGRAWRICPGCLSIVAADHFSFVARARSAAARRHASLSPERRKAIARAAVQTRWSRYHERQKSDGPG